MTALPNEVAMSKWYLLQCGFEWGVMEFGGVVSNGGTWGNK